MGRGASPAREANGEAAMASKQATVDYIVEQAAGGGAVSAKKMFGEYALLCDGKLVALICDNQLFVKPTPGGRVHIGDVVEAPPYRNAKPCLLIDADAWDDGDWLAELIRVTARELPPPKAKKPKKR